MIQKAFILGAGLGTRLRPLTMVRPKPLVPLFHKPMMQYALDRALGLGIHDIAINTHHLARVWEDFFPTFEGKIEMGLNGIASRPSRYKEGRLSFFQEDELLETGGGICNLSNWIGEEDVLVYNGDIYCTIPLEPLVKLHETGEFEATLILRSEGPATHVALEGNRVTDIRNKLGRGEGTHQFTGIYVISAKILKRLKPNKKESIIGAFMELAREGKLGAIVVDEGEWFDLGTREMYLEAHRAQSMCPVGVPDIAGGVVVPESAKIKDSWVSQNVSIGENVKIENSVIWEGVRIGEDVVLKDSIIFSSVPEKSVLASVDH